VAPTRPSVAGARNTHLRHSLPKGETLGMVVGSGMFSLIRNLLALLGCALHTGSEALPTPASPPPSTEPVIEVRGPPEHCRASYVFVGPAYEQGPGDGIFRQYPAVLEGAAFGACTLMGPTKSGDWLWVVMSWERGFRGELSCWIGEQRSPTVVVLGQDGPLPGHVKIKFLDMAEQAAQDRVIPSGSDPCPGLSPADAEPTGLRFQ
jgi:hypothetical protein